MADGEHGIGAKGEELSYYSSSPIFSIIVIFFYQLIKRRRPRRRGRRAEAVLWRRLRRTVLYRCQQGCCVGLTIVHFGAVTGGTAAAI